MLLDVAGRKATFNSARSMAVVTAVDRSWSDHPHSYLITILRAVRYRRSLQPSL
jgi:hypothetical protein